MPIVNDRKPDLGDDAPSQFKRSVQASAETPVIPSALVIELGDLTTGPEAEVSRLKSNMSTLNQELNQIRGQHAGLASEYQKLTGELRDIKLVLAKAHAKELGAIEARNYWVQSLNRLREIFQGGFDSRKNIESRSERSSLGAK